MEPKEYSLSLWFMTCTAIYILTTPRGSGHKCTRPTPIQLAMLQYLTRAMNDVNGKLETVEMETESGKWSNHHINVP